MDASTISEIRRKYDEIFCSPNPYKDVVIISDKSAEVNAAFLAELNSERNQYVVKNGIIMALSSLIWEQSSPGVFMTRYGTLAEKKAEYIYKNVVPKFQVKAIVFRIVEFQ